MSEVLLFEKHIDVEIDGLTAVDLLSDNTLLSKQKIKTAMQKGCVWHTIKKTTHRLRRAKKLIPKGSQIHIYYDEKVLNELPLTPQLIADEGEYSVWNKPCGMWSQGSKWGDHCTITRWAEQHLTPQRNAFAVHRLDKAASGLILVAHSKQSAARLSQLFATRKIDKIYHAAVTGCWKHKEPIEITTPVNNKPAMSIVTLLEFNEAEDKSLLEIKIETGRKHQIRQHLAISGYPIIGDRLHGSSITTEDLNLSSVKLSFNCPMTEREKSYQTPASFQF